MSLPFSDHEELWIPAARLEEFNANIVGDIEVVESFGSAD